jgi:hypothetical protein
VNIVRVSEKNKLSGVFPLAMMGDRYDPKKQFALFIEVKSWTESNKMKRDMFASMAFAMGNAPENDENVVIIQPSRSHTLSSFVMQ